jgi:hypothetical protein
VSAYAPVQRPNGKWYHPRKLRAAVIDDDYGPPFVVVLGTHNAETAQYYAQTEAERCFGSVRVADPRLVWHRKSISNNEPVWVWDSERGAAGVVFAIEEIL